MAERVAWAERVFLESILCSVCKNCLLRLVISTVSESHGDGGPKAAGPSHKNSAAA